MLLLEVNTPCAASDRFRAIEEVVEPSPPEKLEFDMFAVKFVVLFAREIAVFWFKGSLKFRCRNPGARSSKPDQT